MFIQTDLFDSFIQSFERKFLLNRTISSLGVAPTIKILQIVFSFQIQKFHFGLKLDLIVKVTQQLLSLNQKLVSPVIIRTNPVLHNDLIFGLSAQIILKNHKDFLALKSLQNVQSISIIDQNDWSLRSFINRVFIRNSVLNLIARLVVINKHSQSTNDSTFVSLIRVSTNPSLNQKDKLSLGLRMLQFLTTKLICILRSKNLNFILFFIRNGSKGTHGVFQTTLNTIETQLLLQGLGLLDPKGA